MNFIPKAYAQITQGGDITGPGLFQQAGQRDPVAAEALISRLVATVTVVAGLAFLTYFILGGLNWVTAAGDQAKVDKAKKQLTDAAIGLVVVVVSYFIVGIVGTVLGINILNPATVLLSL